MPPDYHVRITARVAGALPGKVIAGSSSSPPAHPGMDRPLAECWIAASSVGAPVKCGETSLNRQTHLSCLAPEQGFEVRAGWGSCDAIAWVRCLPSPVVRPKVVNPLSTEIAWVDRSAAWSRYRRERLALGCTARSAGCAGDGRGQHRRCRQRRSACFGSGSGALAPCRFRST
jgi:hypothetical protein